MPSSVTTDVDPPRSTTAPELTVMPLLRGSLLITVRLPPVLAPAPVTRPAPGALGTAGLILNSAVTTADASAAPPPSSQAVPALVHPREMMRSDVGSGPATNSTRKRASASNVLANDGAVPGTGQAQFTAPVAPIRHAISRRAPPVQTKPAAFRCR